jgi:hypothetical protein
MKTALQVLIRTALIAGVFLTWLSPDDRDMSIRHTHPYTARR